MIFIEASTFSKLSKCAFLSMLFIANVNAGLIVELGELVGATAVVVDGKMYDVHFVDGSCIEVFEGCEEANFFFHTSDESQRASQALVDQVFIDGLLGNFDSEPDLMRGCDWFVTCTILTPYEIRPPSPYGVFLGAAVATNNIGSPRASPDDTAYTSINIDADLTTYGHWTYAYWVSEPSSILTMILLLLVLTMFHRTTLFERG